MGFDYAEYQAAFPWFFPLVAFVVGACVGSFLNVVIYRVPQGRSVVFPGSHCACGQPIAWYDNVPILSWLLLRGRARCCGRAFSVRYPAIEFATGVLFLVCWLHFPPAVAVCGWVFVSALLAATFIDLDHMIIPDVFTLGLAVAGVVLSMLVPALHGFHGDVWLADALRALLRSIEGVLIGSALVLWVALLAEAVLRKEAMGFGDVKFVGAIGAFCGWQGAVVALFGGAVVGTIWFAVAKLWTLARGGTSAAAPEWLEPESETRAGFPRGDALAFGTQVPFGPMLAIAGAAYFLFLQGPVRRWLADVSLLFA